MRIYSSVLLLLGARAIGGLGVLVITGLAIQPVSNRKPSVQGAALTMAARRGLIKCRISLFQAHISVDDADTIE
jgi:hypothetical protein